MSEVRLDIGVLLERKGNRGKGRDYYREDEWRMEKEGLIFDVASKLSITQVNMPRAEWINHRPIA